METIILLLLVGILCFVMGAGLTYIRKNIGLDIDERRPIIEIKANDLEKHKIEIMLNDGYYYYTIDSHEEASYLISEKITDKIQERFDLLVDKKDLNDGGTRYTFEFYTKNK